MPLYKGLHISDYCMLLLMDTQGLLHIQVYMLADYHDTRAHRNTQPAHLTLDIGC